MKHLFLTLKKPLWSTLVMITLVAILIIFIGPIISIGPYTPLDASLAQLIVIIGLYLSWCIYFSRQFPPNKSAHSTPVEQSQATNKTYFESKPDQGFTFSFIHHFFKQKKYQRDHTDLTPLFLVLGQTQSAKSSLLSSMDFSVIHDDKHTDCLESDCVSLWAHAELTALEISNRLLDADTKDSMHWISLVRTLKQSRAKHAVNGIILTYDVNSLTEASPEKLRSFILGTKRRIQELNSHLGYSTPVYLTLTKADNIAGFLEFCNGLKSSRLETPLGFILNAVADTHTEGLKALDKHFDQMVEALIDATTGCVVRQDDGGEQALFFAPQLYALKKSLRHILGILLTTHHIHAPINWRGLFITSTASLPEAPAQWVSSILPKDNLKNLNTAPVPHEVQHKKYFVEQLVKQVFLPHGLSHASETGASFGQLTPRLLGTLACVLCIGFFGFHHWQLTRQINYQSTNFVNTPTSRSDYTPENHSWEPLIQKLNRLNTLLRSSQADGWFEQSLRFVALKPSLSFEQDIQRRYESALQNILLPELSRLLRDNLLEAHQRQEAPLTALQHYLSLVHTEQMDHSAFEAWLDLLWDQDTRSHITHLQKQELLAHVRTLLALPNLSPELDTQLIAQVRGALHQKPLPIRLYEQIKAKTMVSQRFINPLSSIDSTTAYTLFNLDSEQSFSKSIPMLYSFQGYFTQYLPERERVKKQLLSQHWVMSNKTTGIVSKNNNREHGSDLNHASEKVTTEMIGIENQLDALYFKDYISIWEQYLSQLDVKSTQTIDQAFSRATLLNDPSAPLQTVFTSLYKHLSLNPLHELSSTSDSPLLTNTTLSQVSGSVSKQANSVVSMSNPVQVHFSDWHKLYTQVQASKQPLFSELLASIHLQLSQVSGNEDANKAAFDALTQYPSQHKILNQFPNAPKALIRWINTLSEDAKSALGRSAVQHVHSQWASQVRRPYNTRIRHQFPFDSESRTDLQLKEFVEFFGPTGTLNQFFSTFLSPLTQPQQATYRWNTTTRFNNKSLRFFEHLQKVQHTFFDKDGELNLSFWITPQQLDKATTSMHFLSGDSSYKYFHGPLQPKALRWPVGNVQETRLTFFLISRGVPVTQSSYGSWSLFRFFQQHATIKRTERTNEFIAMLEHKGIQSSHTLKTQTHINPFAPDFFIHLQPPVRL